MTTAPKNIPVEDRERRLRFSKDSPDGDLHVLDGSSMVITVQSPRGKGKRRVREVGGGEERETREREREKREKEGERELGERGGEEKREIEREG